MQVASHTDACHTGARGESSFANHFVEERIFISQPLYDLWGADFVVEWKGALCKVNVKVMYWDRGRYKVGLTRGGSLNRDTHKKEARVYSDAEVNYFGVVNLYYKRIWMVPLEATLGRKTLSFKGPLEKEYFTINPFDWEKYRIK